MVNLLSTSEIHQLIENIFDALTWVAVIVTSYLILDWLNDDGNGPDLHA